MLLFTNEPVKPFGRKLDDFGNAAAPFQPGDIYVVRYMSIPTFVTVNERKSDFVRTWMGDMTVEQLNSRVLFLLGRRSRFLGMWMPWALVEMKRVLHYQLAENVGTDEAFWRGSEGN